MKKHIQIVSLTTVKHDVLVCWGMTLEEVGKYVKKNYNMDGDWEQGSKLGRTTFIDHKTVIWLKYPPKTPETIAILAHEALHAVGFIYDSIGIPYRFENDETIAYAMEYIITEVLRKAKK